MLRLRKQHKQFMVTCNWLQYWSLQLLQSWIFKGSRKSQILTEKHSNYNCLKWRKIISEDAGIKSNIDKTFIWSPKRNMNNLCTFSLLCVSAAETCSIVLPLKRTKFRNVLAANRNRYGAEPYFYLVCILKNILMGKKMDLGIS